MKLSNFLRFYPSYQGKGLARGNQLEEVVWNEFANDKKRLKKVAEAIRSCVGHEELAPVEAEGIAEAEEGTLLTRLHRYRERSGKLVARRRRRFRRQPESSPARSAASI